MKLPHDVWLLVLKNLPVKDLANFSATNKEFNMLGSSDLLWFGHCWELIEGYWFAVILPEKKPDQLYKEYYTILRKLCSKPHVRNYKFNFDSVKVGKETWTCINDFEFKHSVWKMCQDNSSVSIGICSDSQCDSYLNNIVCFKRNKTFYEKLHLNELLRKNVEYDLVNLAYAPYADFTPDVNDEYSESMNCRSRLLTMSSFREEFTEVAPLIQNFEIDPECECDWGIFVSVMFLSKYLEPIFQSLVKKRSLEIHRVYYVLSEIIFKALMKHEHFEDDEVDDESADTEKDDGNEDGPADPGQDDRKASVPEQNDGNDEETSETEQNDENDEEASDPEQDDGNEDGPADHDQDDLKASIPEQYDENDDQASDPERNEVEALDMEQDAENANRQESDEADEKEANLLQDVDDGYQANNEYVFGEKTLEECHYIQRSGYKFDLNHLIYRFNGENLYTMAAQIYLQEILSSAISVMKNSELIKYNSNTLDELNEKSNFYVSEFLEKYLDSDVGKVSHPEYENVDSSFCMLCSSFCILNLKNSSNYIMSRLCKLLFDEEIEDYFDKKDFKKGGKMIRRIDLTDMKNDHEPESVKMFVTDSHAVVVYVHSTHC